MQSAYGQCTNKISNRADLSYRADIPYVFSFSSSTEYFKCEPCARYSDRKAENYSDFVSDIERLITFINIKFKYFSY